MFICDIVKCANFGDDQLEDFGATRPLGVKFWASLMTCIVFRKGNKKLSYCWETVRRESMPRIAEMDVEMTT